MARSSTGWRRSPTSNTRGLAMSNDEDVNQTLVVSFDPQSLARLPISVSRTGDALSRFVERVDQAPPFRSTHQGARSKSSDFPARTHKLVNRTWRRTRERASFHYPQPSCIGAAHR